ncbi:hypothetical protein [Paenibacillus soyae]|uniref:Uncharacterized protein n=1 Tax=Paenibacillus soyae TaxID=2969249 RepID=A0A9X2SAY8_9BACL|nr:hypothetical protein [Paenibacillus soyae]MCR2804217.1 hypothetical protein [Paenibacillus soyae]
MPHHSLIAAAVPLNAWVDIGATTLVLLLAAALIGVMFLFIRAASSDNEESRMLRDIVETIFGTPAHLRAGGSPNESTPASSHNDASSASKPPAAFREPCPGCGAEVTEQDANCPSCELRLL